MRDRVVRLFLHDRDAPEGQEWSALNGSMEVLSAMPLPSCLLSGTRVRMRPSGAASLPLHVSVLTYGGTGETLF